MSREQPYNCTRPGNLFVGRDEQLRKIISGCKNGNSYAILGGRRTGKTSLLMQLTSDMQSLEHQPGSSGHCLLPVYLDMQALDTLSAQSVFERLLYLVSTDHNIEINHKIEVTEDRAYEHFLKHLQAAVPAIEEKAGSHWIVVFLIDELDNAVRHLSSDQFFHNLRNLLMTSRFAFHVRMVASGVTDMQKLISSGSPLNNLRKNTMTILQKADVQSLVAAGFDEEPLAAPITDEVLTITGRHPWMLQSVLENLWASKFQNNDELSTQSVHKAARQFLSEHATFDHWFGSFGNTEHAVYQALARSPEQCLSINTLNKAQYSEDALEVLSYHGVIDDDNPDEPKIAGTLFRDWYLKKTNVDSEPVDSAETVAERMSEASSHEHRLKLFLASSSELRDHRDQLELHLLRKNKDYRKAGFDLDIIRWETFLDAMAEEGLQAEYNKAVRSCDIFVSLFRTRTGKYTEQEFDVAHQQFLATGLPKIYTFFQKFEVSTNIENRDPLTSLWKFQDRLKELEHYYTQYNNIEDLKSRVHDQITRLIKADAFA